MSVYVQRKLQQYTQVPRNFCILKFEWPCTDTRKKPSMEAESSPVNDDLTHGNMCIGLYTL